MVNGTAACVCLADALADEALVLSGHVSHWPGLGDRTG